MIKFLIAAPIAIPMAAVRLGLTLALSAGSLAVDAAHGIGGKKK